MTQTGKTAVRQARVPWRFVLFTVLLADIPLFHLRFAWPEAALLGFAAAALVFFATLVPLFRDGNGAIREQAERNDPDQLISLAITVAVLMLILFGVGFILHGRADAPLLWQKILVLGTLLVAWLFFNMVFALHYAHLFYAPDRKGEYRGGIDFPGERQPGYWDFAYFAYTLGMTFQTSDVEIHSPHWRRIALVQSFAAFVFNIGVIAFTINSLSGG